MDTLIERCQQGLGETDYNVVFEAGLNALVNDIRSDLEQFGVTFDQWFSERALVDSSAIDDAIEVLKANDKLYEKEGAWWFDHLITIWGADHHGYVARVKAAFKAMDKDPDALKVLLVQFAILYRGGEKVSMSTRGGDFVTLRELRKEVGTDAARFFYVMRKSEQHMDFDLDLAKSQSSDNPVYYVQYAHARVCSVYRQLEEKGMQLDGEANLSLLVESHETELMTELARYPEVLTRAARDYAPHQVAYYLRDLANAFHTYYNAHPFISADDDMRHARLVLIDAVRQVITL